MASQKTTQEKYTSLTKAIEKANKSIVSIDIKGKQYAPVNERIKAFREVYPNGRIKTEIISQEDGVIVIEATVYNNEDRIIANAHAYEKENSSFINKTSYVENCETSAIGRALGIAGFGVDISVSSYEEVENAIENQDVPITKSQYEELLDNKDKLIEVFKEKGIKGAKDLKKLTLEEADEILRLLDGVSDEQS